jgi:sulfate adenylyltransferase subunit 1
MTTPNKDHNGLLRFTTAGSVDDGKSTLIGRLLYDSKSIFEDQLEAVESASSQKGIDGTDLSLLTDGLKAEREQGITIDVAYRYFATPKRKFIIADTPGHIQYTRNMVTGASTADLAIILIDARHGLLEQTHRHSFIASLLGLQHVVVCVNKMDLVGYSEERFNEIVASYKEFSSRLDITDIKFIPISALLGDNVVETSEKTPWYGGGTLLHHLETVHVGADRNLQDCRFPIQYVIRPQTDAHRDFRGYAGRVASGVFKVGDEVVAMPSGQTSKIKEIFVGDTQVEKAFPPLSVAMTLEDDIDLSRGDLLARPNNQPSKSKLLDAKVCWLSETPLNLGTKYILRHTSSESQARIVNIHHEIDINTLHRVEGVSEISVNAIARIQIKTASEVLVDDYRRNKTTGSFLLIDPSTHQTVAAGVVDDLNTQA